MAHFFMQPVSYYIVLFTFCGIDSTTEKGDLVIIGMPEVTLYDDGTTVFCLWWVKGEAECLFLSPKIGQDSSSVLCLIIIFPYHCCFLVLYFVFLALSRTDKVGNYHIIIL